MELFLFMFSQTQIHSLCFAWNQHGVLRRVSLVTRTLTRRTHNKLVASGIS